MRIWWIVMLILTLVLESCCLGWRTELPVPDESGAGEEDAIQVPGGSSAVPQPKPSGITIGGDYKNRRGHVIQTVTARVLPEGEGAAARIELDVSGYQSDGCLEPVQVDQMRDGNTVSVSIYRALPPDAICTQMIVEYQATIALDGTFASGTYTITVNGYAVTVTV